MHLSPRQEDDRLEDREEKSSAGIEEAPRVLTPDQVSPFVSCVLHHAAMHFRLRGHLS